MPHSIADRAVFSATPVLTLRRDRNRFTDLLLLLVALSTLIVTTMRLAPAIDEDFWWHLRTGQWILSHHAVPIKDMFSARAAGQPWIDYSWLFDVLTAKIFEAWGYRGILGMTTLLSLASTAWLTVFLARYVNLRRAMILSFSAYLALLPLKSPRPWLLTILFFIVELSLLSLARERRHPAWLLPIVPLFASGPISTFNLSTDSASSASSLSSNPYPRAQAIPSRADTCGPSSPHPVWRPF